MKSIKLVTAKMIAESHSIENAVIEKQSLIGNTQFMLVSFTETDDLRYSPAKQINHNTIIGFDFELQEYNDLVILDLGLHTLEAFDSEQMAAMYDAIVNDESLEEFKSILNAPWL